MNQAPPAGRAPRYRACFSGDLACSGVNPCDPCAEMLRRRVNATALVASGLGGVLLASLQDLANQLALAGIDPARWAPPHFLHATTEEQVAWFQQGWAAGFAKLHADMRKPPEGGDGMGLAGRYHLVDVTTIEQALGAVAAGASVKPPPPGHVQQHNGVPGEAMPAPQAASVEGGIVRPPPGTDLSDPAVIEEIARRHAPPKRRLTPEDVAAGASPAAAAPAPPSSIAGPNGVG